ncbi:MAG TPA: phage holin family protein [Candidatus Baltobacteraceae bacterium]|jgi:putative membrane protein|nr:phage holin family protein [Candidatus Baltobacteraceae bacterium]
MPQSLLSFLKRWLITAVAVALAAQVVHGIDYSSFLGLLLAALLLGLLNAFVRPVMLLLSLPLLIFTLGLFILVINAFLLYAVGHMLKDFHVYSFGAAFWGSLVISIISLLLNSLTKSNGTIVQIRRGKPPPRRPPDDPGDGPVIDV